MTRSRVFISSCPRTFVGRFPLAISATSAAVSPVVLLAAVVLAPPALLRFLLLPRLLSFIQPLLIPRNCQKWDAASLNRAM